MNKTFNDYKDDASKLIDKNIFKLHVDLYSFFQNYNLLLEEVDGMLGTQSSMAIRQEFTDKYNKLQDVESIILDLMGIFKLNK